MKNCASRFWASLFRCQTSLPCAYPCSSVAFLGIAHPCLCISVRLIILPGHASPFRFTAFQCNAYPTRRVHSHFRCRSALRFAPLSHCEPVHHLTVPCPCSAMPCQADQCHSIPMHRPSTRRLAIAAPGHAIHCASASIYITQLCLCVATRFSTNPLHPMRNKAVPQQNLATLRSSFASPCVSMLCDAVAIQNSAEPLRSLASPGFSVHRHCFTSQSQPSQSLCCAAPCQSIALQFISIPLPDDALLLCASPLLLSTAHDRPERCLSLTLHCAAALSNAIPMPTDAIQYVAVPIPCLA